ncbi:uncharacterized protein UHOR_07829 [Ustilago hordei]|uniref:Uncharacterized protein n=1 Tax=Ustilago hordei TaxID=120017 RepID=I2FTK9_USTHO|nr:uncharacterized protein UHOR_07829 [Ustilago hordei]
MCISQCVGGGEKFVFFGSRLNTPTAIGTSQSPYSAKYSVCTLLEKLHIMIELRQESGSSNIVAFLSRMV